MTHSQQETLRRMLSEPPILIALFVFLWRGCHPATGTVLPFRNSVGFDAARIHPARIN